MRRFIACLGFVVLLGAEPSPKPSPSPAPSPFAQLSFRNIGPATAGGRLSSVAGTDRDPSLYFIGSAGGGVWKSTNAGVDWHPVFDDQPVMSIGAVAIDPTDSNIVWAGGGEANPRNDVSPGSGIYKSTDSGKTWRRAGLENATAISTISIDPSHPKTVVVGALGDPFADSADRGIYRTTDGGATWDKVLYLGPSTGASDIARSGRSPNVLFAGMWQMRRTGWSINSGGDQDGLFRSTDGGATWQLLSAHGLPSDQLGRIAIAVAPSNAGRVYALIQSKQGILWRSDDGGENWQLTSSDTNVNQRPFYFSRIFVDPTNQDRLFSESVHMVTSSDGGKTWHNTGRGIHGDHHAMWIAADGRRIIEGNDGGVAFSHDGGATWNWRNTIPIGQLYHIGFDRSNPYRVCAPLQDNGVWCAPNNSRSGSGITSKHWDDMGGGDGAWVLVERNTPYVWLTSGGGNNGGELSIYNERTQQTIDGSAYLGDQNVVTPASMKYRFNWETPIAFDPFDRRVAYTAGNVLFVTHDRARHWKPISPDLTRNDKSHEQISGGVTLEGTGAETSETILYIEPSTVARGQIWIGTDDGLMQLTRDGGKHWKNVTPPGIEPFGRFASISASTRNAAQAYIIYDRHMTGDRTPYVFKTSDYGNHWQAITNGLPAGTFARSVRQDPRNANIVYLGTEFGLYASFDGGAHWQTFAQNMPSVSVRDIRVQPDFNDLLVGTHGRDVYILDDLTPVQQLNRAKAAGTYAFPVRASYLYQYHSSGNERAGAGQNPPYGAGITYWLNAPAKANPTADIFDSRGRLVRHFGTHDEDGKQVPDISNQGGFNRFSWDLNEDKPIPWNATADWNQFDSGATVVPGTYRMALHIDSRTLVLPIDVRRDPRDDAGPMDHAARYALEHRLLADWSRIDTALNTLSTVQREADIRKRAVQAVSPGDALLAQIDAIKTKSAQLQAAMTSNPKADQDDDFLTDLLRERVQSLLFTFDTFKAPTAAQENEGAVLHALTNDRVGAVERFVANELHAANDKLVQMHLTTLQTATTPAPKPASSPGD